MWNVALGLLLLAAGVPAQWEPALEVGCDGQPSTLLAVDPDAMLVVTKMELSSDEAKAAKAVTMLELRKVTAGARLASLAATVMPTDVVSIGPGPAVAFTQDRCFTCSERPLTLWWPIKGRSTTFETLGTVGKQGSADHVGATSVVPPVFSPQGDRLALIATQQNNLRVVILDVPSGDATILPLPRVLQKDEYLKGLGWDTKGQYLYLTIIGAQQELRSGAKRRDGFVIPLDTATLSWGDAKAAPSTTIDRAGEFVVREMSNGKLGLMRFVEVRSHLDGGGKQVATELRPPPEASRENSLLSGIFRGQLNTVVTVYIPSSGSKGCVRLYALTNAD